MTIINMSDLPQTAPLTVLNCFDQQDDAYKMASELEDLFEKYGTRADIYVGRGKFDDGWLVYMCSYKLQKKYLAEQVSKIRTGA